MRDANETVLSILEGTSSYADQSDAINEAIGELAVTEQHIREYHEQTAEWNRLDRTVSGEQL